MPITFNKHGNPKPYGLVDMTYERFVEIFSSLPNTKVRNDLIKLFFNFNSDLTKELTPTFWAQLIGGSYTTKKREPNDIDVVNLLDPTSFERIRNINGFVSTRNSKDMYSVDSYAVPVFEESDPRYHIFLDQINYWEKYFGRDRKNNKKSLPRIKHI